jgi:ankyrin repeat protein
MNARELPPRPNLEQYKKLAKELVKVWKSGSTGAILWEGAPLTVTREQIRRRHPRLAGLSESDTASARFTLADAQFIIAREYGFDSWPKFAKHIAALTGESSPVSIFELAVDAVITGELATLESLLRKNPQLIRERSTRVHQATLLHYLSANGVEDYRQKSPKNAVKVAEILLNAGAEVDGLAETYGGGSAQTTLCLLVSSTHPAEAGVQAALVETLLDFGAAINGVEDDGLPLMTALAFGYRAAAETLAARGARVDNIVAAAGLGHLDQVKSFVGEDGSLKADVPLSRDPFGGWMRREKQMEQALIWACLYGRTSVADFLLEKGVAPGAQDGQGETGLHWAAHAGHLDTVKLLIKRKAPLEVKNRYGGTVLGQATWSAINAPRDDHALIIEALIEAGAKVEEADYPTGNESVDAVLRRRGASG